MKLTHDREYVRITLFLALIFVSIFTPSILHAEMLSQNQNSEYDTFLGRINPQELVTLDNYYDQFMSARPNLSAYQLIEVLQSNIYRFEAFEFKDKYLEGVRTGLLRSYTYLKEAYESKLESISQVENPMAMVSAVSKSKAKQSMIAPNILTTLLCYEKTHAIEDYNNAPDLQALIKKYRNICKFYEELKEE